MSKRDFDAIIIGAGFAGMYMLHKLRGLGFSAKVIEAGEDVGGTWYWNRYPGARCDVESFDYSYSFDPELQQEWEWSERYATQPEILRYLQHVADRYDLRRDIDFETRVTAAHWQEDANRWTVETDKGDSYSAHYVVAATGCLSSFNRPNIPGLDDFTGDIYATGTWPHEGVDFTGKRVAVIGTGSSAIQSIPQIARQATQLTVFQRTPNFAVPAQNYMLTDEQSKEVKAKYDELRKVARQSTGGMSLRIPPSDKPALATPPEELQADLDSRWEYGGLSAFFGAHPDSMSDLAAAELSAEYVRNKIRQRVNDPEVAELLCPKGYPFGSKRLCVDIDYFETYNRDNVRLVDLNATPIETITETGVQTSSELFEVDDIVLATGFDAMTGSLTRIDIQGRGGLTLEEKWAEGTKTYLGLMNRGFPNLFTITGPGSPSVMSNMPISIEQHVDWIAQAMVELRDRGAETIEPLAESEEVWTEHNSQVAEATIYVHANNWYLGANIPGKPRVFMPYLGGVGAYRNICDEVQANGYCGFAIDGEGKSADVDFNDHVMRMRLLPAEAA